MLEKCSTRHAPWFVIPSNHKWFRNLAVSTIIADTLDDLRMQPPKPSVDLDAIRKQYHAAAEAAAGRRRSSSSVPSRGRAGHGRGTPGRTRQGTVIREPMRPEGSG